MVLIGAGLAFVGSQGGYDISGFPIYALCIAVAFLIQRIAFIPAYLNRTEKFYDLTGGITYITVTLQAVLLTPNVDARADQKWGGETEYASYKARTSVLIPLPPKRK